VRKLQYQHKVVQSAMHATTVISLIWLLLHCYATATAWSYNHSLMWFTAHRLGAFLLVTTAKIIITVIIIIIKYVLIRW